MQPIPEIMKEVILQQQFALLRNFFPTLDPENRTKQTESFLALAKAMGKRERAQELLNEYERSIQASSGKGNRLT